MLKLLIAILFLGFTLQNSRVSCFIKKNIKQTEQYNNENQKGEENSDTESKIELDKMIIHNSFQFYSHSIQHYQYEPKEYSSSGFYRIPFSPPRKFIC